MKLAAIMLSLSVLLTNCMGLMLRIPEDKLEIKNDSFKGTKIATLEMQFNSEETVEGMGMTVPLFRIMGTLHREVLKDAIITFFNLKIFADQTKDELKGEAYIKIDNNTTMIQVNNRSIENHTSIDTDTTGIGEDEKVTDVSSNQYKILKGKIHIKSRILKKINKDSKIQFRLYSGDQPITFSIEPKRMDKVIKLLSVK